MSGQYSHIDEKGSTCLLASDIHNMLPGLPILCCSSASMHHFQHKPKNKNEVGLGTMQGVTYRALWVVRESSRHYRAANPLRMTARRALEWTRMLEGPNVFLDMKSNIRE